MGGKGPHQGRDPARGTRGSQRPEHRGGQRLSDPRPQGVEGDRHVCLDPVQSARPFRDSQVCGRPVRRRRAQWPFFQRDPGRGAGFTGDPAGTGSSTGVGGGSAVPSGARRGPCRTHHAADPDLSLLSCSHARASPMPLLRRQHLPALPAG